MGTLASCGSQAITTGVDVVRPPHGEPTHRHREHELVWHVAGTFRLESAGRSWSVSPGSGVWLPAGTVHRTVGSSQYSCGWALVDPERCPELWARTAPIVVEPLLRALLAHLATSDADGVRDHAEAIVLDQLGRKLSSPAVELPMPIDDRARRVVNAILGDPTHPWGVEDWATEVGASTRTLSRVLLDETGMSFSQWRVQARLRQAMSMLADAVPVAVVGRRVGYQTTSAFVSAFRRLTGVTPGSYASSTLTDVNAARIA